MVDGGLKVSKGALVLLRGIRESNLYFLLGHSIGGRVITIGKKPLGGPKFPHMKHGQVVFGSLARLIGKKVNWKVSRLARFILESKLF